MQVAYLNVKEVAELMGVSSQAIYKAIDHRSIIAEKEMVNRKLEVRIPLISLIDFAQGELKRYEQQTAKIRQAVDTLRRMV